ncbi:MAG: HAMP domain-containing protein [Alphaproteobacteria bacterium]|nr:HAMP domain-containing protein [Alphaproteobacteria bacterium]
MILLQIIATWFFYNSHWDTVTRRLANSVAGDITTVIDLMAKDQNSDNYKTLFTIADKNMDLSMYFIPKGILPTSIAFSMPENFVDKKFNNALSEYINIPFLIDSRSEEKSIEIRLQLPDGLLHISTPRRRLFSSTTYVFILWMIGSSFILYGIAITFMRNQIIPIKTLAKAAEEFGKGRETEPFKPKGATEVRQAATAFNRMRDRIKRQINQRTEMLAGVSHDLRTPLTRMKLQLAMVEQNQDIDGLKEDLSDMEKMVEEYLAFARGEGTEQSIATNIKIFLEEFISGFQKPDYTLKLTIDDDTILPIRRIAFKRCLTNLINNAQRYSRYVIITCQKIGKNIDITIDDDGPGIPEEKREEVFKPFFRLEKSRNLQTGGVGLGLTIARDIIRSHGGDLVLDDSPQGGLRAKLRIPI